jgi:MOSC domain-containing protein YiiM
LRGEIVQLNISKGGLPKRPIAAGICFCGSLGLAGDEHAHPSIHGGPLKAILLIAVETLDELEARGYPVYPGAMGENLTTRGIDLRCLRVGDRLRAGAAELEITRPRGPCTQLDVYGPLLKYEVYDEQVRQQSPESPRWGMSGLYTSVIKEGEVRVGDAIELISGA